MQNRTWWIFLALLVGLAACSTAPKQQGFEPDESASQAEQILPDSSTNKAVLSLLDNARQAVNAGRFHTADSQLERALRIEPRNPVLWHYMAKLRLHQDRVSEAIGFANKSNSLAGHNNKLLADNWRIIAHARNQQGDHSGAKRAQQKVEELVN